MSNPSTAVEHRHDHAPAQAAQAAQPKLLAQIDQVMPQLERLGVEPSRFARVLLTECRKNEQLLQCTPASFMGAAFASAQLALEPGPLAHVWFIPRRNKKKGVHEVQWMMGFRGMVELARRAGVIVTVETVYEGDQFEVTAGTNPSIEHRPVVAGRGEAYAWYAVARFADGRTIHRVLNRDDVEERRKVSTSKDRGPWVSHYDAMARKSAIRALWSQLPMVPELQDAARIDEQVLSVPGLTASCGAGAAAPEITAGSDDTADEDEPAPTGGADPIDRATVNDLRTMCRDAGLEVAGSRAELIDRLVAARSDTSGEAAEPEEPAADGGPPRPPPPVDPDDDVVDAEVVDDQDEPEGETVTDPQRRKLFALFHEHGITERQRVAVMRGGYAVTSMNDLTDEQTAKLIDVLERDDGPERFRASADEWIAALADGHDSSVGGGDGEASPPAEDPLPVSDTSSRDEEPEAPAGDGPSLEERAYARAQAASPAGQLQTRIRNAWRTVSVADEAAYQASWERVAELLDKYPGETDWSHASEVELRREAEDLEQQVARLETEGKVR